MKKTILLAPLLLLMSCYNVERNCTDFKTGKFKFEYEIDGVKKTTGKRMRIYFAEKTPEKQGRRESD